MRSLLEMSASGRRARRNLACPWAIEFIRFRASVLRALVVGTMLNMNPCIVKALFNDCLELVSL